MKTLAAIFVSIIALSAFACDATKAISGPPNTLVLTLQPGVPHVETWDFTDCGFGITSDSFYVTKPRTQSGLKTLPASTPLTVTLHDLTTDTYYSGGFIFYGINNFQSVCGHVLEMTLTLSASAHKDLKVEITQVANWGGACE